MSQVSFCAQVEPTTESRQVDLLQTSIPFGGLYLASVPFPVRRLLFLMGKINNELALIVFYFRLKMLNSVLYRKGAIQKNIPYMLTLRYYWKSLIGTAGAWFLYVTRS